MFLKGFILVLLLAAALMLRVTNQRESIENRPFSGDAASYFVTAYNLLYFGVYSQDVATDIDTPPETRTDLRPVYPLFLYALLKTTSSAEETISMAFAFQSIVGTLTCLLTFLLARLCLSFWWALVPALLTAFSPHLIAVDGYLITESFFTASFLGATLLFVYSLRQKGPVLSFLAGIVLGIAHLVRIIALPAAFIFVPLYFLVKGARFSDRPRAPLPCAMAFIIGFMLLFAPYKVWHHKTVEGTPGRKAYTYWSTFVDGTYINHVRNFDYVIHDPNFFRIHEDREYGRKLLMQRFMNDPGDYLRWYLGGKALFMWGWDNVYNGDVYQYPMKRRGFEVHSGLKVVHRIMRVLHWPLLGLSALAGIMALVQLMRRRFGASSDVAIPISLIMLYHTVLMSIFVSVPRYSIPLRPYAYILAVLSFLWISSRLRRRKLS